MHDNQPEPHDNADVDIPESEMEDQDWLDIADRSFRDSDVYLDSGLRKRWERNYSLARSEHPSGSKYHTEAYQHKSRVFRGKTHGAIRRNLAACAVALFSTEDTVSIKPEDDSKEDQKIAAGAIDILQNFHLDVNIPWYQTVNGAYREALTNGFVVSKQWWKYEFEESSEEDGEEEIKILSDHPVVEMIPPENFRISPAADWQKPIDSSPYCIILYPMFVVDVKERSGLDWLEVTDEDILSALNEMDYDSIRQHREGKEKPDSKTERTSIKDYDIVWVRENFIRKDGKTIHFYSLGRSALLSNPVPVERVYPHVKDGRPPLHMGFSEIEPFSLYPQGLVERCENTQIQANEIANQRFDNVRQVLNVRHLVQRGKNVDYRSLMRNVSGSTTLTDDINAVKPLETKDVTGSSYKEQDMINVDFDELSGTFSTASVATNRQLNETVGGMQLLSGNSNVLTEYVLRTFVESWVEPVMRDIVDMIKTYEENDTIQRIVGQPLKHSDLQAAVNVKTNVGFGATDPTQKTNKLMFAMETVRRVLADPNMQKLGIDGEEFAAEIFGSVGYRDAARFVPGIKKEKNPQVQQLQEQLQKLQKQMEGDLHKYKADMEVQQFKAKSAMELEREKIADKREERLSKERIAEMQMREKIAELAAGEGKSMKEMELKLGMKNLDHIHDKEKLHIQGQQQRTKQADDLKAKIHTMNIEPEKSGGHWPG